MFFFFFFFNDTATTEIYTLSLHDALPIFVNIEQGAGTANSTNTINIGTSLADSNNNLVNIEQDNTETNTVTMDIEGASNIVNITQD